MSNESSIIATENYSLKLLDENDLVFFLSLYQDKKLMSFVGIFEQDALIKNFNQSLRLNQSPYFKRLTYIIHQQERKIGIISLVRSKKVASQCELGTIISPTSLNKGVAAETVESLIEHAFNQLNMQRVYASCTINNSASSSVMKKLNFVFEESKNGFHHCFIDKKETEFDKI